ncbi:MAG: PAAR domain-containing protein [Hyphomicrobiaceae bacterium]
MGQPAAKQGDQAIGVDTHIVMVPSPNGQVPTPLPHPFAGVLDTNLSPDVRIEKRQAATNGSIATNTPAHIPTPPGVAFQVPPPNRGPVSGGSATVRINRRAAARAGDTVDSCDDLGVPGNSRIVAASTVRIG